MLNKTGLLFLIFGVGLLGSYLQLQPVNSPNRLRANEVRAGKKVASGVAVLRPGVPRAVPVMPGSSETGFVIPVESRNYLLIVGCLRGNFRQNHFSLEAAPLPGSEQTSLTPLEVVSPLYHPVRDELVFPEDRGQKSSLDNMVYYGPVISAFDPALKNRQQKRLFSFFTGTGNFANAASCSKVNATLLAESRHLRIWWDSGLQSGPRATVSSQQLERLSRQMVTTFEQVIVARLQPWLGEVSDLDQDGKFSVLLTSHLARLQHGQTSLTGLTWPGDYRRDLGFPFGNRADLVYLNPQNQNLNLISTVLVHEYVHALVFDHRLASPLCGLRETLEEDWLNEALAHVVETRFDQSYANIDYRLNEFRQSPGQFPLVVPNYYRAKLWRSHGCRGATYSFLDWCISQRGIQIIPGLLYSDQRGLHNLESWMGKPFEKLFRQWTIAQAFEKEKRGEKLQAIVPGKKISWTQSSTSAMYFRLSPGASGRFCLRIKNEPESGVQLTLLPLPDSKAEEAFISRRAQTWFGPSKSKNSHAFDVPVLQKSDL